MAEAVRLAVERSAQLASQSAMADAAREMSGPAAELPDPKLKVGVENVPTDGPDAWSLNRDFMTMSKIGLMQEFPREEKRKLKAQRALKEAERGTAAVEASKATIRQQTAIAWIARYFASETERLVAAQLAEAEIAVAVATGDARSGKTTTGETVASQVALVEITNRATEAALQSKRARIALGRYIGSEADRLPGTMPDFDRLPFDVKRLEDHQAQPEVQYAQAQQSLAATEAEIARAAKQPDWSAEVSYAVRGSAYANMVSLMFTIDLPWSAGTKQDREYAAKLKELDAAREMVEDSVRIHAAEVETKRAEWEAARTQADRIRAALLPLAAQRVTLATSAYANGAGPLSTALEARRTELDIRLELLKQQQVAAQAWAWLRFVLPGETR